MNNFQKLHELFKQILEEELVNEPRIYPYKEGGAILFKREDEQLFGVLIGETDVPDAGQTLKVIHRNLLIKNLNLALTVRHFDINMITPYLKTGIKMAITEMKKILDDPKLVKEALEREERPVIYG